NTVNVLNTSNSQPTINNKIDEYESMNESVPNTTTKIESSASENNQPENSEPEAMNNNEEMSKDKPNTGEDNNQSETQTPMDTSPPLSDATREMS
ncbi:unnamed protein product, partial [Rotaria socialis]